MEKRSKTLPAKLPEGVGKSKVRTTYECDNRHNLIKARIEERKFMLKLRGIRPSHASVVRALLAAYYSGEIDESVLGETVDPDFIRILSGSRGLETMKKMANKTEKGKRDVKKKKEDAV